MDTTNPLFEIRPMRIDRLQGLRRKVAPVDDWLSRDICEDPIEAIVKNIGDDS